MSIRNDYFLLLGRKTEHRWNIGLLLEHLLVLLVLLYHQLLEEQILP